MRKPTIIKSIWDLESVVDRYTVILSLPENNDCYTALCLSDNPLHPQGVSQFSTAAEGDHLGKRIQWFSLSEALQKHIIQRVVAS